jgi:hypothetical protein
MDAYRGNEVAHGDHRQSDEDILQWIGDTADTTDHPISTCRMDPDPMPVVDERLPESLRLHFGRCGLVASFPINDILQRRPIDIGVQVFTEYVDGAMLILVAHP